MQTRAILSAFFISFLWMVSAAPQGVSPTTSKDVVTDVLNIPDELAALYYLLGEDAEAARAQGSDRVLLRRDIDSSARPHHTTDALSVAQLIKFSLDILEEEEDGARTPGNDRSLLRRDEAAAKPSLKDLIAKLTAATQKKE
ncbi:hypothetical protein BKA70DRAFT_1446513 [Coprinopsis sp. MPI-PUGE-AT-0042]|nr:hypothetical protein BKA70DRAFT_1446513 [Coprinopsis sp. MPI-PUGE-AT-0042]